MTLKALAEIQLPRQRARHIEAVVRGALSLVTSPDPLPAGAQLDAPVGTGIGPNAVGLSIAFAIGESSSHGGRAADLENDVRTSYTAASEPLHERSHALDWRADAPIAHPKGARRFGAGLTSDGVIPRLW